jgi:hypothetical protein
MRQALTFFAIFQIDAGDGYQTTPEADRTCLISTLGTMTMLSIDQFLRFISVPAVMAAFLIASQVSGVGIFPSHPTHLASE